MKKPSILFLLFAFLINMVPVWAVGQSAGYDPDPLVGAADNAAPYLLINANSGILSGERVFTPDAGDFNWTDGGAGSTYTFSIDHIDFAKGGITGGTDRQSALNALLNFPATTGDTIYFNGTNWVDLGIGSDGDVLTVDTNVPAWEPPSLSLGSDLHFVTTQAEGDLSNESVLTGTPNRIAISSGATIDIGGDVVTETSTDTLTNKSLTGVNMTWNSGNGYTLKGQVNDGSLRWGDWGQATTITIPDPATSSASVVLTELAQTIAGIKTFSAAPVLSTGTLTAGANLMTFPSSAQTLVGRTSSDTLSNKILTLPHIGSGGFILDQSTANYNILTANPAAGRDYTITDVNGNANFAMTTGTNANGGAAYGDGFTLKYTSAGSSGHALVSGGAGAPSWAVLGIAGGGTNNGSLNVGAGRVMRGDGSKLLSLALGSAGQVLTVNAGATDVEWAAAASGGHTIKEEGSGLTARAGLNFVGGAITATDDAGNNETDVTIDSDINTIAALTATAGNIIAANDSNAWTTLAGGSNGNVLMYDSAQNPNVKWGSLSGWNFTTTSNNSGFTASANTIHLVDSSGGAVTCTLPTAASIAGTPIVVSLRTAGNNLTINTTSSQTIDGQASGAIVTNVRYNTFVFVSDGSNWMLL